MIRKLLTIFLLCASAAATVTVRAKLTDGTGTVSKTAYLHFQLENCGPNIPSDPTIGAAAIQTNFDLRPNQPDGTILYTNLLSNDEIFCGGVASTYWVVTPMKDQSHPLRDGLNYVLHNGTTFDPSVTQAMITVPLAPPQDPLCCGSPLVQGQGTGGGGSGGGGSINCNSPNANVYWLFGLLCDPFFTDDGVGNFTAFSGTFIGPKAGWINLFPGPTPVVPSLAGFQLTAQTSMSGPVQWLAPSTVGALGLAICVQSTDGVVSDTLGYCPFSGGSGNVTSVNCGNLSPLFTCATADPTGDAVLSFTLSNAAANTVFGNFTGSSGAPSFNAMSACGDATHALAWTAGTGFTCQAISAGTSITLQTNSVNNTSQALLNFTNDVGPMGTTTVFSNPSGGVEKLTVTANTLNTPSAPTLTTNGSAGSTTISYKIVGCQDGPVCAFHSPASTIATIATANGTLTSSNSVNLKTYADTLYGYRCYNVYRTATNGTSPTTTGLIANCAWKSIIDTGLAGDSTTPPSTNTTQIFTWPVPLPACGVNPGQPFGVDAPPCSPLVQDDEFTSTFQIAGTQSPFWTWVNQNSATATLTGGMVSMTGPSRGAPNNYSQVNCLFQTAPATPYTVKALLYLTPDGTSSVTLMSGLAFRESATGKIVTVSELMDNSPNVIVVTKWTSATASSSTPNQTSINAASPNGVNLELVANGTNTSYSYSNDGVTYQQTFTEAKNAFFTTAPDQIGICNMTSNGAGLVDFDYFRVTSP